MLLRRGGGVLATRLGQAALNAVAGWLVADRLGPDVQGRYALAVFVALMLSSLLNGGAGIAAVPLIRRGETAARSVIRAQTAWAIAAVAVLGAAFALLWTTPARPWLDQALAWEGGHAMAVLAAVAGLLLFDVLVYDLNALGRVVAGPAVNLGRAALFLGLILVLTADGGGDALTVLAAWATAQAAAAVAVLVLATRTAAPDAPARTPIPLIRTLLSRGWVGQMSAVVSLLHLRLDLALVAVWHGAAVVGVYSVAVLVGELLWLLSGALQPVLVHTASAVDDPAGRDRITARAVRLALGATALAGTVLWLLAPWLMALLFGPEFEGAADALRALIPGLVIYAAGAVLASDFIGRGRPAWNTRASAATVVANVTAGLLLIPAHGAVGAAWASTIAYAVGAVVMLLRFRAATGLSWGSILRPDPSDLSLR